MSSRARQRRRTPAGLRLTCDPSRFRRAHPRRAQRHRLRRGRRLVVHQRLALVRLGAGEGRGRALGAEQRLQREGQGRPPARRGRRGLAGGVTRTRRAGRPPAPRCRLPRLVRYRRRPLGSQQTRCRAVYRNLPLRQHRDSAQQTEREPRHHVTRGPCTGRGHRHSASPAGAGGRTNTLLTGVHGHGLFRIRMAMCGPSPAVQRRQSALCRRRGAMLRSSWLGNGPACSSPRGGRPG